MSQTAIEPTPEQTEDSVVWFALLAQARQSGDHELQARATATLAKLGIEVTVSDSKNEGPPRA